MPERSSYPDGAPCWVDLTAPDPGVARAFYGAVMGWEFEDAGADYGHYTMCLWRGKQVAALMPPPPGGEGMPAMWNVYLSTQDIEGVVARVAEAGGKPVMGPHDVPGAGRLAFAFDPTGASFGLWQSGGHSGAQLQSEPGAVCWHELNTTDGAAADRFYHALFGYTQQQIGDGKQFDYTTWTLPGVNDPVCGRLQASAGQLRGGPSAWAAYFAVADVDAAAREVAAQGGTVLAAAFDSPFGRMCPVLDPLGASFTLCQLPAEG
ncbi:VOC family protein [Streptacidiphilus sp. P02-A3a]|uniref:VOC family protein n=1 Tax=Streptacidiphilus sp. P02-A3a TaxID=2704468 RepID=UPI0015FC7BEE|nr:VOC family protein [Streptacidiphilus sp. P02-A3a]QMU70962.1 VOC family protein [Streptacidiphilus sp. P02-A3a]